MRQRRCAALLLCAPLVAGCGTVRRIAFAGHSRPAAPLQVSVWSGPRAVSLDPSRLRPGPVLFDVANQSGRPQRYVVRADGGRLLAQSPAIAAGQTAQIKATLHGPDSTVTAESTVHGGDAGSLAHSARVRIAGRPRTGDSELTQP